ncbi:hypothetical protein LTR85_006055 [Meristemomyces frigidus]|nr:hypothetical protein LTR85_006055 [Meristemomyces frigidus]
MDLYDKNGHLVISYVDTAEDRRRSSIAHGGAPHAFQKEKAEAIENKPRTQHNEAFMLKNGSSLGSEKQGP